MSSDELSAEARRAFCDLVDQLDKDLGLENAIPCESCGTPLDFPGKVPPDWHLCRGCNSNICNTCALVFGHDNFDGRHGKGDVEAEIERLLSLRQSMRTFLRDSEMVEEEVDRRIARLEQLDEEDDTKQGESE
jgi:hypothetical protein